MMIFLCQSCHAQRRGSMVQLCGRITHGHKHADVAQVSNLRSGVWEFTAQPERPRSIVAEGKTLDSNLAPFHWQDGYGLFSVSPSHQEAVHKYILNQEEHHKKETFQEELLRILKKYGIAYDEHYLWD